MKFGLRRWQCIRRMKLPLFLVVGCVTFAMLTGLIGNKGILRMKAGGGEYTQDYLDEWARTLDVKVQVRGVNLEYGDQSRSSKVVVALTNTGLRNFPDSKWQIFFTQTLPIELQNTLRGRVTVKEAEKIHIRHWNGQLYSIGPEKGFHGLLPDETRFIHYYTTACSVAVTDIYPNWYLVMEGLEPRVIESTAHEPEHFVLPHDFPKAWHRGSGVNTYNEDIFNPPKTYAGIKDLGHAPLPLIPTPYKIEWPKKASSVNVFADDWVIVSNNKLSTAICALTDKWDIGEAVARPNSHYVYFKLEDVRILSKEKLLPVEESYKLTVDPVANAITIQAGQPAGALYAAQTLLSLTGEDGRIPGVTIIDGPRYRYRGVMIDVARNFQSKKSILRYIEVMAMYKLNKLHLHLTDDEGWRLEIPGLPELTEIGAKRCHNLNETECILPFLGSGPFDQAPGSGFYTADDYKDIIRYAAAHNIEVIPEFDMPGHSHAAIKSMQVRLERSLAEGSDQADRYVLTDLKDNSTYHSVQLFKDGAINPCVMSAYQFIEKIMDEVIAMHKDISPLRVFHFGGDEVPREAWTLSPLCFSLEIPDMQNNLKELFITKVASLAHERGLDVAAWEDGVMHNEKPMKRSIFAQKNVYAYAWNNLWQLGNSKRAYTLANMDYKVVLTPATNMYFDHPQEHDPRDRGLVWVSRYVDTKRTYQLIPENLYLSSGSINNGKPIPPCTEKATECPDLEKVENIEGIQGTLFGELLRKEWIVDHMLLPRMLALAERAWHKAPWESVQDEAHRNSMLDADYIDFANTLGYKELARLDQEGFLYRIPPPIAKLEHGKLVTALPFPGLLIEMSQDGGETWMTLTSSGSKLGTSGSVLLRTKAAFGGRHSRTVTVHVK